MHLHVALNMNIHAREPAIVTETSSMEIFCETARTQRQTEATYCTCAKISLYGINSDRKEHFLLLFMICFWCHSFPESVLEIT